MTTTENPILVIADDDKEYLNELGRLAENENLRTVRCRTVADAIVEIDRALSTNELVGVVSDLKITSNTDDGWGVLGYAYRKSKVLRLALVTAFGDEPIQELFKSGAAVPAFTVFRKNRDVDEAKLQKWLRSTRESWDERLALTLKDAGTRHTFDIIAPIYARSRLPILILGETGTGKELLAERIHHAGLQRKNAMVSINCGGLEPSLAFSELFGHTANAFTDANHHELGLVLRASGYLAGPRNAHAKSQGFEEWLSDSNPDLRLDHNGLLSSEAAASRAGTLFLDEVATMPDKVMPGLLRILSTKADVLPFGHHGPGIRSYCRIIAATNEVSILESSIAGRPDEVAAFRRDLCYRLGGAILTLAPLRDRDPDDIRNYVDKTVWSQLEMQPMAVDPGALDYIVALYKGRTDDTAHQYQLGNFRTLRNLVHRAALISMEGNCASITKEHFELSLQHGRLVVEASEAISQEKHIREVFWRAILKRGIPLDENFSWEELKEVTNKHPIEVGYGFLNCCLAMKLAPRRGYYQLSEIQLALARGVSLSAWLGKSLSKDHIYKAATTHFEVDPSGWPADIQVSGIVQRVRDNPNERK